MPERIIARIQGAPGVQVAVPSIKEQAILEDSATESEMQLSFFGMQAGGLSIYGINAEQDDEIRQYRLLEGEFLSESRTAGEIVLVKDFAEQEEIELGKFIRLITPVGKQRLRVVGLIAKEGAGRINNGAIGFVPIDVAQNMFDRSGEIDQIDIIASEDYQSLETLDVLKAMLQERTGANYTVIYPASQGKRMTQMLTSYQIGLNFMSGIALFVGAFLIYNVFSMTVVERTREFGMLRTVGMTRQQVTFLVLSESILLGIIGSGLGVLLGLLLSVGLTRLMSVMLAQDLSISGLPAEYFLVSVSVGFIMTVLAALIPSVQAGRISPLEAIRVRSKSKEPWLIRKGWIPGLVLLILSTIILVLDPFAYDVQFRLGSMTVFTLFIGVALLIPGLLPHWEKISRPFLGLFYRASGQLGSRNIRRSRLRSTLTVGALMIGVTMIVIIDGMTGAFKVDLEQWIGAYLGGDLFLGSEIELEDGLWDRVESIPGVEAASPVRYFEVAWRQDANIDETLTFMAVEPLAYSQVTDFVFSDNRTDTVSAISQLSNGNAIFVSSVVAEKYDIEPGDTMLLKTRRGFVDFTVAAVIVDFYNQGMTLTGSWSDMQRLFRLDDASSIMVRVQDGFAIDEVKTRIESVFGRRYELNIISNQELKTRIDSLMGQAFSMFDMLAMIAVIVASLGVINTLTMNVLERIREIGMLRSIGFTRLQTVLMILAEAGLMGMIGGILGIVFGLVLSRIFLASMMAMSGYSLTYRVPLFGMIYGIILALIISQIAAVLPARRASRMAILDAIHYE